MQSKKTAYILIAVIAAFLLLFATHIRIIPVSDHTVLLMENPFFHGGSSAGNDIRISFDEAGKSAEGILDIAYIGTNSKGNYFKCTYQEADGSVSTYFAFDDGNPNSTIRATVLWAKP